MIANSGWRGRRVWVSALTIALLTVSGGSTYLLHQALLERFPRFEPSPNQSYYLPRGELLRAASLGFRQLLADLMWFELVQAVGGTGDPGGFRYLVDYTDQITDLDPRNAPAYLVSSLWLLTNYRFEEANAMLGKGSERFPGEWKFPYYMGITSYLFLRDRARAIVHFREALARLPAEGAGGLTREEATSVFTDPQSALNWFKEHYAVTGFQGTGEQGAMVSMLRHAEYHRLVTEVVGPAVECYQSKRGGIPHRLMDLVEVGCLPEIPSDPYGGELVLDEDGKLRSTQVGKTYWWEKRPKGAGT